MGQHYVPEVYLKQFSHKQGMLYVLNKTDAAKYSNYRIDSKAYRSYCQEKDFYLIDTEAIKIFGLEENIHALEVENKTNAYYEERYNGYLQKIINGKFFSTLEAEIFIKMLVHFKMRNKFWRNSFNDGRLKEIFKNGLKESAYLAINNKDLYPEISQEVKIHTINRVYERYMNIQELEKLFQLWSLLKRSQSDTQLTKHFIEVLLRSQWVLYISDKTNQFIATDNPGFSIDGNSKLHNTKFVDGAKFYFPLSPFYCIVIDTGKIDTEYYFQPSQKKFEYQMANFAVVAIANHNGEKLATNYLFAADKNVLEIFNITNSREK